MKLTLIQVVVLSITVALTVAIARGTVAAYWGPEGTRCLHAAALICWLGAVLAALPLGMAATWAPQQAPMAAFAGTAIRLLVTGGLALAYQMWAQPQLASFLACLLVLYLVLLLIETGLIVWIVLRVFSRPVSRPQ